MTTEAQLVLEIHMRELGLRFEPEFVFAPPRKWRFDYMCFHKTDPRKECGVEIEGGAFTHGRHTRGAGFVKDMEKYNEAALMGFKVFRFTPEQCENGKAKATLKRWLAKEPK